LWGGRLPALEQVVDGAAEGHCQAAGDARRVEPPLPPARETRAEDVALLGRVLAEDRLHLSPLCDDFLSSLPRVRTLAVHGLGNVAVVAKELISIFGKSVVPQIAVEGVARSNLLLLQHSAVLLAVAIDMIDG